MNATTKAKFRNAGWAVGDAANFLELTPQEAQFVDMKLALAKGVRELRESRASRKRRWRQD